MDSITCKHLKPPRDTISVTTLLCHNADASTSALVSSATRWIANRYLVQRSSPNGNASLDRGSWASGFVADLLKCYQAQGRS
ncbi:hypothetical protein CCGE525_26060 (plasmid) [Rhizobium jaguaris]|uniref:Uncharacterized protein n=1 Tax=Rhizobium jaguaris TaxID=1312183 RepID=A0A387FX02_9HYPH|nr:hypothetical protein CCGE525_26060 [Rhizobium jaguaris]